MRRILNRTLIVTMDMVDVEGATRSDGEECRVS